MLAERRTVANIRLMQNRPSCDRSDACADCRARGYRKLDQVQEATSARSVMVRDDAAGDSAKPAAAEGVQRPAALPV